MEVWEHYSNGEKNGICWRVNGVSVKIIWDDKEVLNGDRLKTLRDRYGFEFASAAVYEWQELWIKIENEENKEIQKVCFGEDEAKLKPNGYYFYTFRNYLCKSTLSIHFKDGTVVKPPPIEVISKKTPIDKEDKSLFYPKFLKTLVNDLIAHLISLPFHWSAPTEFATEESSQPPLPIFVLHMLVQNAEKIRTAIETILHNPYRKLFYQEEWVHLSEACSVDADTVIMMLQHPEFLHSYSGGSLNSLAEKLKGKVPEKVFERKIAETFDTPENRFVKYFINLLLYWCDELERLQCCKDPEIKQRLEQLQEFLYFSINSQIFADVGELEIFPASSQVLLKRDGYRECLEVYRLLHLARIPIFDHIQDAIDNRSIDKLYEFWCFFKLAEILSVDKVCFEPYLSDEHGLKWELKAILPDGSELVYNKTFSPDKKKDAFSYSLRLRPDFTLMRNGVPEVVFDAKFRFNWAKDTDKKDTDESIEEKIETSLQMGEIERVVNSLDIYKMHTYRDAIKGCRAAVVLFPGEKNEFYHVNGSVKEGEISIKEIVKDQNYKGVGAISLTP